MLPLAAIALGGAQGIAGSWQAITSGHRAARRINQLYQRGDEQMRLGQVDTRESTNESLAARGLLNAGSGPVQPAAAAAATGTLNPNSIATALANVRNAKFGEQTSRNEVGAAGTLASGVSTDLSKEFLKERQNLYTDKQNALAENKYNTIGGVVSSIGKGIATAATAANAMAPVPAPHQASSVTPSGIPSYGGIDPVDPLASMNGPNFSLTLPTSKGR